MASEAPLNTTKTAVDSALVFDNGNIIACF